MCMITNAAETKAKVETFMISNSEDLGVAFDNFWPRIQFWSCASDDYMSDD